MSTLWVDIKGVKEVASFYTNYHPPKTQWVPCRTKLLMRVARPFFRPHNKKEKVVWLCERLPFDTYILTFLFYHTNHFFNALLFDKNNHYRFTINLERLCTYMQSVLCTKVCLLCWHYAPAILLCWHSWLKPALELDHIHHINCWLCQTRGHQCYHELPKRCTDFGILFNDFT